MAEPGAATQLTLLDGDGACDEKRLRALYDYPDQLHKCWVRSNFISSADGGATVDGKSGGLAGPGDRELFAVMRELADVIVVGAGTVRTENYGGAQLGAAGRQARQSRGQAEIPPIAIVTASGRLDRDMRVFTHTETPPLVLTCTDTAGTVRRHLRDAAEVLDCSGTDPGAVDLTVLLATLAARGLPRVLTEGGPQLHGMLIEEDLLDELCLTIAPLLVGGQARRIAAGVGRMHTTMRRAHLLTDDAGYLYSRYTRSVPGA